MSFACRLLRPAAAWTASLEHSNLLPLVSAAERTFAKKAKKAAKTSPSTQDLLTDLGGDFSLAEAETRMKKSVEYFKAELANIRSGRATVGMLDHMKVETESGSVPLKALGTVTVRDSHVLGFSLFDEASSPSVVRAIETSPLQLQPKVVTSQELLVLLPKQTKETIDALARLIGRAAEQSKTSIRAARKFGMSQVKGSLPSVDAQKRGEKAVDALTLSYVEEIDKLCHNKKRELGSS